MLPSLSKPPRHDGQATNTPVNEFVAGFSRIAEALSIDTQLELAEILAIRQSSISDAKRRGVIPGEWALKLFQKFRLNPSWVYDGLPPMFLGSPSARDEHHAGEASFLLKYKDGAVAGMMVPDTSMEPAIPCGSLVGLNTLERSIAPDCLVGIDLPLEGLSIRRIGQDTDGGIQVLADNPRIPAQRVTEDFLSPRIVGRVVWILRRP